MPQSNINRIRDPLTESFSLDELRIIAPWVAEEAQTLGKDIIDNELALRGHSSSDALSMRDWVSAICNARSPLWVALQTG